MLDKYNECASVLFLPAINLLFLLGVVKYHQKTDCFEYIGK
ncbi:TPA: ABC-three component system middle component 8 [Haemophilus influenzae]